MKICKQCGKPVDHERPWLRRRNPLCDPCWRSYNAAAAMTYRARKKLLKNSPRLAELLGKAPIN